MTVKEVCRQNTYNEENSLDSDFQYTVWQAGEEYREWYYADHGVYISVCHHLGGDPRGNYGSYRVFRVDQGLDESDFMYLTVGYHVLEVYDARDWYDAHAGDASSMLEWLFEEGDGRELRSTYKDVPADWDGDLDYLNSEFTQGYSSNPAYHVSEEFGTDDCYWYGGHAYMVDDGGWLYVLAAEGAYYCDGLMPDGTDDSSRDEMGYIWEASIDSDKIVEDIGTEITDDIESIMESNDLEHSGWDHGESLKKAINIYHVRISSCTVSTI